MARMTPCAMCMRPEGSKPSYTIGCGFFSSSSRSSASWMHSSPTLRAIAYFSSSDSSDT